MSTTTELSIKDNLIQHTTELAMHIVQAYVRPGDVVIDATCGNGHDTLRLARMLQLPCRAPDASDRESSAGAPAKAGYLFAFDIQPEAIQSTRDLLIREGYEHALDEKIFLVCAGHEQMGESLRDHAPGRRAPSCCTPGYCASGMNASGMNASGMGAPGSGASDDGFAAAVVFNLGYLPGGDKSLTTRCDTTLAAIRESLSLLRPGGLISVTMYSGHEEGAKEKRALLAFAEELDSKQWHAAYISMPNQHHAPPEILLITRKR